MISNKKIIKSGDLVLIMDESTKKGIWHMAKAVVQDVMPDSNGLLRRLCLKTVDV